MPEEPETKIAPEKKEPTRNFWPFIVILILICALAYTWTKKDNVEKILDVVKEDRLGLLQTAETGNKPDDISKTVPSLPTGKPVAVAVAKPAQPQPAQGQVAPVVPQKETAAPSMTAPPATQPVAVQSQPAAYVTRDEFLKAIKIIANDNEHLEAKIDACCQAKGKASTKTVTHKKRRPANQPVKSYLPAGPSFSPQQQGDCRVPPGTDYPDRFMPAGPGCSGKTCTQYRQQ